MSAPRTLTFFGGAATATGSMILPEAAWARVLPDAGHAVATMVTILREEGVRDVIVPREGESFPF